MSWASTPGGSSIDKLQDLGWGVYNRLGFWDESAWMWEKVEGRMKGQSFFSRVHLAFTMTSGRKGHVCKSVATVPP